MPEANWTNVGKSAKSKKKPSGSSEANLRKLGVKGMPLEVTETMYEKAAKIAERKAKAKIAALEKAEKEEAAAKLAEEEKDEPVKTTHIQTKSKSKAKPVQAPKATITERCSKIDWNLGVSNYKSASESYPNKPIEWLKAMTIWCVKSLEGKFASFEPDALLKFLKQKEDFSNFTAVLDEYVSQTSTVLAELLRYCVASTVTAGTQHGFTLMIQLLVEREGVNSCDIVIASMIQIFKLYKAEVNKDKVALPLIKAYSQTVINPKLFLQVWQRLQLKLLVDVHTSAKTKEAAMLDLQTIFPVRFDVKQALKNLKASTATFPIETFGLILRVTYSNTTPPNVRKEMTRLYPVLRELSIHKGCGKYFQRLLVEDKVQQFGRDMHIAILQFLNVCIAREPDVCCSTMEARFKDSPLQVLDVLQHMGMIWQEPWAAPSQCGGRMKQSLDEMLSQIKTANESRQHKWKNKNFNSETATKLITQMRDSIADQDDSAPMLWTFVVLLLLMFMGLVFHMSCRFPPMRNQWTKDVCASAEDAGLLKAVDDVYVQLDPYLRVALPYVKDAATALEPAWIVAQPYVDNGMEAVGNGVGVVSKAMQPVTEFTSEKAAEGWVVAAPYYHTAAAFTAEKSEPVVTAFTENWKVYYPQVLAVVAPKYTAARVAVLETIEQLRPVVTSTMESISALLADAYVTVSTATADAMAQLRPHLSAAYASVMAAIDAIRPASEATFAKAKAMTLDAFDVSKKVLSELYTSIAKYLEEVAPVVQNAVDSSLVKLNELKDATVVLLSDMQLTVAEIYQQYAKPTEDTKQK